jgi:hypothetical protein
MASFYNNQTKRYNSKKKAIENGLFENPQNFEWNTKDGLDKKYRKIKSVQQLNAELRQGKLTEKDIYLPKHLMIIKKGNIATIYTNNKQNQKRKLKDEGKRKSFIDE